MEKKFFHGTVKNCESECGKYDGRMTLIELANKEITNKKFKIIGQHRIDRNERIRVEYETYSGINWIKYYSIVDSEDDTKVKYSSICE